MENPYPMKYINMLHSGMLHNYPVTPKTINNANTIFGPDVASLKFKITSKPSNPLVTEYVEIPQEILDLNKNLTLVADVIFVTG